MRRCGIDSRRGPAKEVRQLNYKGYLVHASARQTADGGWKPMLAIYSHRGGPGDIQSLFDQTCRTCATEDRAEELATQLARAWIDGQIK